MARTTILILLAAALSSVYAQQSGTDTNVPLSSTPTANSTIATSSSVNGTAAPTPTSFNTGRNPLIPTSISAGCQTFLGSLNADTAISACTAPLNDILTLFAPSQAAQFAATSEQIDSSLAQLCSAAPCSSTMIRQRLSDFYAACTQELTAQQPIVLSQYDTLYILTPLLTAVCSKDSQQGFCLSDITSGSVPADSLATSTSLAANATTPLTQISNTAPLPTLTASALPLAIMTPSINGSRNMTLATAASNSSLNGTAQTGVTFAATTAPIFTIQSYASAAMSPRNLYIQLSSATTRFIRRQFGKRQAASDGTSTNATSNATVSTVPTTVVSAAIPNVKTWVSTGLPFMFLSQNMTSPILCTSCTKAILGSYVSWELRQPYALGLGNSPLLNQQSTLWTGIGEVCGTGFLSSVAQTAGADISTSAAPIVERTSGVVVAFAIVAIVVAQSI